MHFRCPFKSEVGPKSVAAAARFGFRTLGACRIKANAATVMVTQLRFECETDELNCNGFRPWYGQGRRSERTPGERIMGVLHNTVEKLIASYLQKGVPGYEPFTPSDPEHLRSVMHQGDVLLVEGNNRLSGIIKYLTQSTWSHAALFVGPIDGASEADGQPHVLIEANIGEAAGQERVVARLP